MKPSPEIISAPVIVLEEDTGIPAPKEKKHEISLFISLILLLSIGLAGYFFLYPWLKTLLGSRVITS